MLEQKLRELIISKYKSVRAFSEEADLPYTTVDSILKRGVEKTNVKNIIKLCQVLDIDTDALASGKIEPRHIKLKIAITPEEKEFLARFRSLNDMKKKTVLEVLDLALAATNKKSSLTVARPSNQNTPEKNFDNCIFLQLSEQPASAGTGMYLGPEAFRSIKVTENNKTRRAAFCVRVSGDSMEPIYADGDIVMVSKEPVLQNDIALVTLDGCGYIKRMGEMYLISENKKYKPIPYDENVIVNGRVIGILQPEWIVEM